MDATFENRIKIMEDKFEELDKKVAPLIELLQTIIKAKIDKTTIDDLIQDDTVVAEVAVKKDLVYTIIDDTVYISGTKTFERKDLIKSSFNRASWNKERSAWSFKVFEDCDSIISNIFPDIIKE